jgi:hypothetical protein
MCRIARDAKEELRAAAPHAVLVVRQSQVGLVDERRRVDRVNQLVQAEMPMRDRAQVIIDQLDQAVERTFVPAAPLFDEARDLASAGGR